MNKRKGLSDAEAAGLRKAAILLVSLEAGSASKLMSQFDPVQQERLAREIILLEEHPPLAEERDAVLREFAGIFRASRSTDRGGLRSARAILEKIHPADEAKKILEAVEASLGRTRFEFLKKADVQNVAAFIADEHPQTIALVLSHLPPAQAARVVECFPLAKQQDVVRRLAGMEPTSPAVVREVEKALESRLSAFAPRESREVDGRAVAAALLNQLSRSTERGILEGLKADEPELAEEIRRRMFTFDDLARVNDRGIQNLLKTLDSSRLPLALKAAKPELREKFFRNMSERAVERVKEEMELMGPVRVSDIEGAQNAIVDEVLRLEETGEVAIEGRGGEAVVI
ncbi:MAG TPA: flagellar motor switch protein FliG [Planctomycetota bacterium]